MENDLEDKLIAEFRKCVRWYGPITEIDVNLNTVWFSNEHGEEYVILINKVE